MPSTWTVSSLREFRPQYAQTNDVLQRMLDLATADAERINPTLYASTDADDEARIDRAIEQLVRLDAEPASYSGNIDGGITGQQCQRRPQPHPEPARGRREGRADGAGPAGGGAAGTVVMQNAVPRLRIAVTGKLHEMLGVPTNPETEARGSGLDYYLAQDYERGLAQTIRADRPVLTVHMGRVERFNDPIQQTEMAAYVYWDIHLRQGLIDQGAAGYSHHTANRLWDIAEFIAGRVNRELFLPGTEIGVTDVLDITPVQDETQERVGHLDLQINCQTRIAINATRSLDSDQAFREFFGTRDLGRDHQHRACGAGRRGAGGAVTTKVSRRSKKRKRRVPNSGLQNTPRRCAFEVSEPHPGRVSEIDDMERRYK